MAKATEDATSTAPEINPPPPGSHDISPPAAKLSWSGEIRRRLVVLNKLLPPSPTLGLLRVSYRTAINTSYSLAEWRWWFRPLLRRGRPPAYNLPAINAVIEEAIEGGVDDRLAWFIDRVRGLLETRGIEAPGETRSAIPALDPENLTATRRR
jgi:hypothetical protein